MATKEKRYKYVEDVIEDYLNLLDETNELPLSLKKVKDKFSALKEDLNGDVLDKEDAEDFFKLFNQERKIEEQKMELAQELAEVQDIFKQFLSYVDGHQITYEKKDEVEKSKITYLFWIENGEIKFNRELTKNMKRNKEMTFA
jgi:DNA polymerase III gamma/tau subunit